MSNKNQDTLKVGGTVVFGGTESIGILAPDGTIYWTEGNIGINFKEFHVGVVVHVYYKKLDAVKYPVVVWVEKQGANTYVESAHKETPTKQVKEIKQLKLDDNKVLKINHHHDQIDEELEEELVERKEDKQKNNKRKKRYEHGRNWK